MLSSKILFNNKKHLLDLLEYQLMGINIEIFKSRCDMEKFFLHQKKDNINEIKKQINIDQISHEDINKIIDNINDVKKN